MNGGAPTVAGLVVRSKNVDFLKHSPGWRGVAAALVGAFSVGANVAAASVLVQAFIDVWGAKQGMQLR